MCFPHIGGESDEKTGGSLDPRARERVEEHGSSAHGYGHAPDR